MIKKTIILAAVLLLGSRVSAVENRVDSLLVQWQEERRIETWEQYRHDFVELDNEQWLNEPDGNQIPDSIYESRLRMIPSAIQLPYNEIVRRYIVAYTGRLKGQMENMLGQAQYYFPIIEEELDRQEMPHELKILPMIESAFQPQAVSRAGATGVWQFMLRTGKGMGLEINSFIDERMDPAASTRAACEYLKQMYAIYGDWTLAIAAYNCGPGNINKALRRFPDAKSYWDIYDLLPAETRGYVPSFIAAMYAYTFHRIHGIQPVLPPHPMVTDTVMVQKMLHFEQVATTIDIPVETIQTLNPQYRLNIVPATDKKYPLVLPAYAALEFADREADIYAKDTVYLAKYVNPDNYDPNRIPRGMAVSSSSGATYKVRQGDILGTIARRHGVTVAALMRANNLTEAGARRLRIGQVLRIP